MTPPPPGLPLWSRAPRVCARIARAMSPRPAAGPPPRPRWPRRRRTACRAEWRTTPGASVCRRSVASFVEGHVGSPESKGGKAPVCRSASPKIMAAVTATLSERNPGRMGMISRASAASCTSSGTPADSLPTRMTSSGLGRRNPRKGTAPWWWQGRGDRLQRPALP